jgi:hypothetical protein
MKMPIPLFQIVLALALAATPAAAQIESPDPPPAEIAPPAPAEESDQSDQSDQSESKTPQAPESPQPTETPQAPETPPAPEPRWEDRIQGAVLVRAGTPLALPVSAGPGESKPAAGQPVVSAPWPPKARTPAPAGWQLGKHPELAPVPVEARLEDGSLLRFQVVPPLLEPISGNVVIASLPPDGGGNGLSHALAAARADLETSRTRLAEWAARLDAALATRSLPAPE